MKSLTAPELTASRIASSKTVYVATVEFTAPTAQTLRISDRYLNLAGVEYLPMVQDWGTLEEALNTLDVDGRPATATFSLFNTKPLLSRSRASDLIRSSQNTVGAYEWAFAKVTIAQVFDTDLLVLGVFYLEDPTDIGETTMTVRMTDQALVIENAMRSTVITRDVFPYADQAVLGKHVPVTLGTLTTVPTQALVAGNVTRVVGALSAGATTVPVLDTTGMDSGFLIIDTEVITYSGRTATSFTGCTRGTSGSAAVAHADQATVYDARTDYFFVVGEHDASFKTKAITNIRVDGRPPVTAPTTQLDKTDLVTGKRFAVIRFTPATAAFSIVPFGPYTIAVSTISLSVPAGGDAGPTSRIVSAPNSERLSQPHDRVVSFKVTVGGASPASVSWTVDRTVDGVHVPIGNGLGVNGSGSDSRTFSTAADDEIRFSIHLPPATAGSADCEFTSYTVNASAGGQSSTAQAVIGTVTCDVQGIQDDTSGTVSGTPSLLLENPADIARFILRQLYSVTDFGTTWTATRASLAAAAYKWGALFGYATFSSLRRKLGEQARSALFIEAGRWEYRFLDSAPAAQIPLDYLREVWNGMPAQVSRTTRTDVRNSLSVSSQLDPSSGDYRRAKVFEDLAQPGFASAIPDTLNLDLVQDAATADALGAYWLAWKKRQHFAVELVAWWNLLPVDKIDYLSIANHPVLAAHGGTALVFRVVGKSYLTGDDNPGRIRLRLVEV